MRVYNEPCEATENEDGSPRTFVWREREYTVIELVDEWRSMRPWWIDQLPEPMDHEVRHYRVRASSSNGQGLAELEHHYEGWRLASILD
ncbi:hypothetical protein Psi02_64250 [Planotetraspora silvatica]|uniref:DUF6504 domain-containing protein n=1 Tax=Planotetraspora silvatica TaxID=234614 RepID=A0A8J3XS07_9ACTN|nr:DUF6504 family protein [Planotetraspora silvatica]GII50001.1 hypothetical protein Psi02_64250 [Planotetraspora silvatica]